MRSRLERLHALERLLLDEAKSAHARAVERERASLDDARRTLDDITRVEAAADAVVGDRGPVAHGSLRHRALLSALIDRTAAAARYRISAYAATRKATESALAQTIARDLRRKGIETIAGRRAAALLKRLDQIEEGMSDDLPDRRGI